MATSDASILRLAEHLLATGTEDISLRQRQVIERAIRRHRQPGAHGALPEEDIRWHERLADRVAAIGGSWTFILCFGLSLVVWAVLNSYALSRPFDAYPYIFLNLLLSMLAAIQAPLIMMSQNRLAAQDRRQAKRDFEINLKAELEILALHGKLDRLLVAAEKQATP